MLIEFSSLKRKKSKRNLKESKSQKRSKSRYETHNIIDITINNVQQHRSRNKFDRFSAIFK